jgi:hypothetical protein
LITSLLVVEVVAVAVTPQLLLVVVAGRVVSECLPQRKH